MMIIGAGTTPHSPLYSSCLFALNTRGFLFRNIFTPFNLFIFDSPENTIRRRNHTWWHISRDCNSAALFLFPFLCSPYLPRIARYRDVTGIHAYPDVFYLMLPRPLLESLLVFEAVCAVKQNTPFRYYVKRIRRTPFLPGIDERFWAESL